MAKISEKKRERIDRLFTDVIREKMNDDQFWDWVRGWKDPENLVEQAEDWDTNTKLEELKEFRKMGLLKKVV